MRHLTRVLFAMVMLAFASHSMMAHPKISCVAFFIGGAWLSATFTCWFVPALIRKKDMSLEKKLNILLSLED